MTSDPSAETGTEMVVIDEITMNLARSLDIEFADPEAATLRIAMRTARALTVEELLAADDDRGWKSHLGEKFTIRHVDWMRSSFRGGFGFFAVVDAVNADGEPCILTCGATQVVIQLARLMQKGWNKDYPVKLVQNKNATADGYYPLRLIKA